MIDTNNPKQLITLTRSIVGFKAMPYFQAQEGLLACGSTPPFTIYGSTHTDLDLAIF